MGTPVSTLRRSTAWGPDLANAMFHAAYGMDAETQGWLSAAYRRHRARYIADFERRPWSSAFEVATFEQQDPELRERARVHWEAEERRRAEQRARLEGNPYAKEF